jgi:hypothetical protein
MEQSLTCSSRFDVDKSIFELIMRTFLETVHHISRMERLQLRGRGLSVHCLTKKVKVDIQVQPRSANRAQVPSSLT